MATKKAAKKNEAEVKNVNETVQPKAKKFYNLIVASKYEGKYGQCWKVTASREENPIVRFCKSALQAIKCMYWMEKETGLKISNSSMQRLKTEHESVIAIAQ